MYYHIKPDLSIISFIFSQLFFGLGPSGLIPEVTVGSLIIGFHQEPLFQLLRGEELFLVDFPIFISHDLDLLKIFGEGEGFCPTLRVRPPHPDWAATGLGGPYVPLT